MDKDFYKEETLCGHLVTTHMKKLWSVELGCLAELKRICEKYHIKYFASGGTLLGAIRHKGFIPWDDDIDVVMMADDYYRFCDVAPKELSEPYFFQDFKTEPDFGPSKARIRNSNTTGCTKFDYEMADGKYNCGCFIDIFPMFGVEKSILGRFIQKLTMCFWIIPITGYEMYTKSKRKGRWSWKMLPFVGCWKLFSLFTNHRQLCMHFLKACDRSKEYDKIGLLSFSGFNKKWIWRKEWYADLISLPFEYTEISCPMEYDKILRQQFGDYSVFKKGTAVHTMVLWDAETPFKERLKEVVIR